MKLVLPSLAAVGLVSALAASSGAMAQQSTPADHPVTSQDADNTRTNRRDRNDQATTTPFEQSNDSSDVNLVANVRKAIVNDGHLSMKAHNVKVFANKGMVTLRGPVASAQEKARVQQLASGVRGVSRVDNMLDIETDESH